MYCRDPETTLFGDLPESERPALSASLKTQPAENWDNGTVSYCGWKDVPSVYLICENDDVIPPPVQEHCAALAGSRIERCSSGHVPQLSQPVRVVEVIKGAIAEFSS
jgi:pimeloyl-ACP methyl ester carboxylesterase